jgi:peptidyl-prolyl isomerase F (cyclophilin D)
MLLAWGLTGKTLNFEVELMTLERIDVKHSTPFKVFFDISIGDKPAGKIIMEVRLSPLSPTLKRCRKPRRTTFNQTY